MYVKYFKRIIDFCLSLIGLIVLSPVLILLMMLGTIFMQGNPFFVQERPGKNENVFKLIKFRTMDNRKDKFGNLLSDEVRLNKYGRFLRSTSLDELPELINILKGDMAIVGPRPLIPRYIPYYTEQEHRRHNVRPGLTGLAQVNGRSFISWEEKFYYDLKYVDEVNFCLDVKIIINTVKKVLTRESVEDATKNIIDENGIQWCVVGDKKYRSYESFDIERKRQWTEKKNESKKN